MDGATWLQMTAETRGRAVATGGGGPGVYVPLQILVQLNKCETGPYFLQNFQCTTMFISVYCKICELNTELKTEHEIVFAADVSEVSLNISCKSF